MIPKQLQNLEFRFCKLKAKDKIPFEKDWTNKGYQFNDLKITDYIERGGNYGCIGGFGRLRILDIDDPKLAEELKDKLNTFTVKTGGGGMHFYFISDYETNHVFINELGELRAKNYQCVGSGCTHPNGKIYQIINDSEIITIPKETIAELIKPYLREEQESILSIPSIPQGKDTSGSGLEYRRVLALIREGKTREKIYKEMEHYTKWSSSGDDYKNLTYNKAMDYHLQEQEQKKEIPITDGALKFLKDLQLFEKIDKDFEKQITGEEKSRKAIFLSLCSIWVKNIEIPLNTFVSSESSAGKSFVCKKILQIFPKELFEYRSKISSEAFTYWKVNSDWNWDGKICYLEDVKQELLDSPTFKIMCSEGSIATVVKNQKAIDLVVKGKPCILVTTAETSPSNELLNRFSIVSLDESSKQTKAITLNQALEIKNEEYNPEITEALRHLKREDVTVLFAPQIHNFITQNYSWNDVRMRRDFSRLRDLIKCSTTLHQFQREKNKEGKLIATKEDYDIARDCINYIQTTTLKGLIHKLKKAYDMCIKEQSFTAKDIHSKYPFVSQKMWYNYLDDLCERGLLTTELRDSELSKKRITYYFVPKSSSFKLPEYKELIDYSVITTIDTIDTIDTINTNDSNDKGTIETIETINLLSVVKNKKDAGFDGIFGEDGSD